MFIWTINVKKIIVIIFLLTTSCSDPADEQSILDKSSCVLPCWNEITPGQTTETEVLEILKNLPDIDADAFQIQNRQGLEDTLIFFSFRQNWILSQRPKVHGTAYIINNIVSGIIICGKINTSMHQLVELTGEPENIISGNSLGGGRTVILINSQEGISFFFTTELDNLVISPSTEIDCIYMFDPSLYEEMLNAGEFSSGYYNAEETRRVWYQWNGYGNLEEMYPPRQP